MSCHDREQQSNSIGRYPNLLVVEVVELSLLNSALILMVVDYDDPSLVVPFRS